MKLHIVTVATHNKYYLPYLIESCKRNGIILEVLGMNEEWKGFNWRYKKMIKYLKNIPPSDLVCFVDGYDVICCRNLDEMPNVFFKLKEKHNCKVIFAEEKVFNFFIEKIGDLYFGKCNGKKINAGTYIGLAGDLLKIIIKIHAQNPEDNQDDQVLATNYFKENIQEMYCDTKNKLFLTLVDPLHELDYHVHIDSKTKILTYNSHKPFFIHAPGYGFLENIIRKLGYKIDPLKIKNELYNNFIQKKILLYPKIIISNIVDSIYNNIKKNDKLNFN